MTSCCKHGSTSKYYVVVKVDQSCLTLCNPVDDRVRGILWANILEWVAVPFSRASSQPSDQTLILLHCRWIPYQLSHQGNRSIM